MTNINLIEFFNSTARKFSSKTAVIEGEKSITFRELKLYSQSLAYHLQIAIGGTNVPVAVFLPKCIDAVIADIAITYSGNIYMNLDVKNPKERICNILDLVAPQVIVTNTQYVNKILEWIPKHISIINIDEVKDKSISTIDCAGEPWRELIDTDPYCIINTSGSTGTPKGVVLNHKSFIDFMDQTFEEFKFDENDVVGSLSPVIFDIWSYELCLLMGVGVTIVIIPESYSAFPVKILQLMQNSKVTYVFWVPTIMVNIANLGLLSKISLPQLRLCWFAGEVFPTKQFNEWRRFLPHTIFANFYGPIEITLDCVYYVVKRNIADDEPLPIGKPFRNTGILILDENDKKIVEPNREGELCVRGSSLAMGYYNNHEKTSGVFVQNPLNKHYPETIYRTGDIVYINNLGEIVFKGRKDSLIKHMGYRIELGEIEHIILNRLQLVKNGCVVYNHQDKEITLFYESDKEIAQALFRKEIGTALPKYMIPTAYFRSEELKRNPNGKIDRLYYNKAINDTRNN